MFGEKAKLTDVVVDGPPYLRRFPLVRIRLFGRDIVFAFVQRDSFSPSQYARHAAQLAQCAGSPVVYVFPTINGSRRNAFLRESVGFVVPGNQFFLPPLLDIKEWKPRCAEIGEHISFAAQAVLIRHLVKGDVEGLPMVEIASRTGYSSMTITKVAAEFEGHGLAVIIGTRPKSLQFKMPPDALWKMAERKMRSPVVKTLLSKVRADFPHAGITALSERSNLAPPDTEVVACVKDKIDERVCQAADSMDDAKSEIQIWAYSPLVAGGDEIDKYSLYLSLRSMNDPRVEGELEDLMETK